MKFVINTCFGRFGLSNKAIKRYIELRGQTPHCYLYNNNTKTYSKCNEDDYNENLILTIIDLGESFSSLDDSKYKYILYDPAINRNDPYLIQVVEELGEEANGRYAKLKIVEYDIDYEIDDYDGKETLSVYMNEVFK